MALVDADLVEMIVIVNGLDGGVPMWFLSQRRKSKMQRPALALMVMMVKPKKVKGGQAMRRIKAEWWWKTKDDGRVHGVG